MGSECSTGSLRGAAFDFRTTPSPCRSQRLRLLAKAEWYEEYIDYKLLKQIINGSGESFAYVCRLPTAWAQPGSSLQNFPSCRPTAAWPAPKLGKARASRAHQVVQQSWVAPATVPGSSRS